MKANRAHNPSQHSSELVCWPEPPARNSGLNMASTWTLPGLASFHIQLPMFTCRSIAQAVSPLGLWVALGCAATGPKSATGQTNAPLPEYHIYAGNTHSHRSEEQRG